MQPNKKIYMLSIATSLGLFLFWILFFFAGIVPDNATSSYLAYEHAFPPADIILATALLTASLFALKDSKNTLVFKVFHSCGGALIFLGILDVTFNLQNNIYFLSTADFILNAFINLWCIFFGLRLATYDFKKK